MAGESHAGRLTRVETDVNTIRSEMGSIKTEMTSVKADIRGLGGILERIEDSVTRSQDQQDQRLERSRPNMVAVATVLITIISILVGGAWTISGQLATTATRLDDQGHQTSQLIDMRNREFDYIQHRLDRMDTKDRRDGDQAPKQ